MTSLSHLNLSYNNLSGRIPTGNQLAMLDPSIYAGNINLCGTPLPKQCPGNEAGQVPVPETEDKDDESETIWIFVGGMIGFVVGIWSFWGALLLKKSGSITAQEVLESFLFQDDRQNQPSML